MITSGIALAPISAVFTASPEHTTGLAVAALNELATPTPVASAASRAGSTNGLMLMGLVIVVIVLVPILLRRSMWTK